MKKFIKENGVTICTVLFLFEAILCLISWFVFDIPDITGIPLFIIILIVFILQLIFGIPNIKEKAVISMLVITILLGGICYFNDIVRGPKPRLTKCSQAFDCTNCDKDLCDCKYANYDKNGVETIETIKCPASANYPTSPTTKTTD